MYTGISEIDWDNWEPSERATLLFVVCDGQILLIEKKRGIGAGKINGPGGRLEPGESPRECAIREVEEELCVTPTGVRHCGELSFQFIDGYALHGSIFIADGCRGEACETDEATPVWTPLDAIPYERMWADDIHWMPHILAGLSVRGRFIFDGEDCMIDHEVLVMDLCEE
jgi:8-oxo-dGTP diphosphatase